MSVRRYTSLGRLLEDTEDDREAFFVHFNDHQGRVCELEAEIDALRAKWVPDYEDADVSACSYDSAAQREVSK